MIIYLKQEATLAGSLWEAGTKLEIQDKLGLKAIAEGIASAEPEEKKAVPKPDASAKKRGRPKKED